MLTANQATSKVREQTSPASGVRRFISRGSTIHDLFNRRSRPDLTWWRAVILANAGEEAEATRLADALMTKAPRFAAAARRFGDAGLMDQALLDRLLPERRASHSGGHSD